MLLSRFQSIVLGPHDQHMPVGLSPRRSRLCAPRLTLHLHLERQDPRGTNGWQLSAHLGRALLSLEFSFIYCSLLLQLPNVFENVSFCNLLNFFLVDAMGMGAYYNLHILLRNKVLFRKKKSNYFLYPPDS